MGGEVRGVLGVLGTKPVDEQDGEIHGIKVRHRVRAAWQAPREPHHPVAEVVDVA